MQVRPLLRLLLLVLPVALAGTPLVSPYQQESQLSTVAGPHDVISGPGQSIPAPIHDESTCAFCQAAAFAPHASSPACGLPEAFASECRELVSRDDRLPHVASSRPPSTRAPPTLRDG
jgi:hypothetical protein